MNYEIDDLDKKILGFLQNDSRKPFLEIARELEVSGGTIHARVNKLREEGIIQGSKVIVNYNSLGFTVCAFIGITLVKAGVFEDVQERLKAIPEIVEVHYTTGTYSLFAKVLSPNVEGLYQFLTQKLQRLEEIQSTETFIILNTPIDRDLNL